MRKILLAALAAVLLVCPRAAFAQFDFQGTITSTTCTGTGGGTVAQETGCIVLNLSPAIASVSVQITGTYTATLQFEVTNDSGTWVSANAYPLPSGVAVTSTANGTGIWQVDTGGAKRFRLRASAYTSTPTVTIAASLDPVVGAGGVAQVQGTTANDTTAVGNSVETAPAIAVTAPVAVTAGRAEKLQVLTANGGVLAGIVDTNTVRQAGVLANDATARVNGLDVNPGVAKAGPTALTAARSEALQLDNVSGGVYVSEAPTTNATGLTTTGAATVTTSVNFKASAGNLYGFGVVNGAGAGCWLQCVNSATAGTLGTAVIFQAPLPTSATAYSPPGPIPLGSFSTGIACGVASAVGGASACGTAATGVAIYYK